MDTLYKLQPHRTMQLRGFNDYGATAALWGASDTGFTISGVWGEQSDFVVVELWNADNVFDHPRLRYLPDTAFDGMVLEFDLAVSNCMPLDSDYWASVDWPYLNVLYADGTTQQIRLSGCATAVTGVYAPATGSLTLRGTPTAGDYIELAWGDNFHFNYAMDATDESTGTFARAINSLAYAITSGVGTAGLTATASGATISLTCTSPVGANGNRLGVYGMAYGAKTEVWSPESIVLSGGTSPTKWHLQFAFSGSKFNSTAIRQIWLTFAPPMAVGAFVGGEFSVTVTNWAVTDPNGRRALKVAGAGSVRIEESGSWVARTGYWEQADSVGYWSQGRAIRAAAAGAALTIETHCSAAHDIYLGTRIDSDCGIVQAALDGGTAITLDCYGTAAQVRRCLFAGVSAGAHQVVITLTGGKNASSSGWYFYFDFLECAVLGNVPDAPETRTDVGVATDFDTDNTYKLSPERLIWSIQKLGLVGEVDHYAGVFWWPARKASATYTSWAQNTVITLSGSPNFGDHAYLSLGGAVMDHLVLIGDTLASVATAFALRINKDSAAFWAATSGAVLHLWGRAAGSDYHMDVAFSTYQAGTISAAITTTNRAVTNVTWQVDDTATSPINKAVTDWHSDYFAALKAAGIAVTVAFSAELVNPPDNPPGAVWVQRFPNGTKVETATGFGSLYSSQVAFSAAVRTYMGRAYAAMAGLMVSAGITPRLQFGEVLWWYQAGSSGMAFYDADTTTAAQTALGRSLATFLTVNDDPSINSYADADFLRTRLYSYVNAVQTYVLSKCSSAVFELLWPLDVNDPDSRRLLRYVNLPTAWQTRFGSGFDTFIAEGFEYGGVDHNVDKAKRCAAYPFAELGWTREYCRYLVGWFYSAWPWQREYLAARSTAVPVLKFWAWDHICLFGWAVPLPTAERRSTVQEG